LAKEERGIVLLVNQSLVVRHNDPPLKGGNTLVIDRLSPLLLVSQAAPSIGKGTAPDALMERERPSLYTQGEGLSLAIILSGWQS
jgi:hypothetical protein